MIRKVFIVLLSVLYLLPAVGFSIDLHRCGKRIKVVEVYASHKLKCPCNVDMPADCCKDVHIAVKIKDNQCLSKNSGGPKQFDFKQFQFCAVTIGECLPKIGAFDFSKYHAPPFKFRPPIYLTAKVFRI